MTVSEVHSVRTRPDVSVQIVNYKSKAYLDACLASLLLQSNTDLQQTITVVDNNSGDDLSDLEQKYSNTVRFYSNTRNLGFGAAHNALAKMNDGRALLLLNPDTVMREPDTVARLSTRLYEQPKTAVVGPKLIQTDGQRMVWDHGDFLADVQIAGLHHRPYLFPTNPSFERHSPTVVPWVSGAVFLIEKAAFEAEHGFDEQLFLYFEEVELCYRLLKAHREIIYDPTIAVEHIGSVSTKNIKYGHFLKSFEYVVYKHHHPFLAALLSAVYRRLPKKFFE